MSKLLLLLLPCLTLSCASLTLSGYRKTLTGVDQAITAGVGVVADTDRVYQMAVAQPAVAQAKVLDASGDHAQGELVKAVALSRLRAYERERDSAVKPALEALRVGSAVAHASLSAGEALGSVPADLPAAVAKLGTLLSRLASALPAMVAATPVVLSPDAGVTP